MEKKPRSEKFEVEVEGRPLSWEEIEVAVKKEDASHLVFEAGDVLTRVETVGDLFAPALSLKQQLPDSPRAGTKKRSRT